MIQMAASNVGKIRLRNISDLQKTVKDEEEKTYTTELSVILPETPKKSAKTTRSQRAATTTRKRKDTNNNNGDKGEEDPKKIVATTAVKRTNKKEPPQGQMRIDCFFKSAAKNYKVEIDIPKSSSSKSPKKKIRRSPRKGRKRLFDEETTTTTTTIDSNDIEEKIKPSNRSRKQPLRQVKSTRIDCNEIIDLCSDGEEDVKPNTTPMNSKENSIPQLTITSVVSLHKPTATHRTRGSPRPCPPYKIIEGTTFCVDGFQFGEIPNVSKYFLTHFHADHYIGLTRKFARPIYMSPITARLVRTFIHLDEIYINEIEVDQTIKVDDIEITALDANHCPGALMFFFKLSSGQTILHTGDFRANFEMESLPIFWSHPQLDLLYLDTTYMNKNYDFCHQSESIDRALRLVKEFHSKHMDKRILHVCGSYVIGKEKIWLSLAKEFLLNVWTDTHRRKAIECLQLEDAEMYLCDDPRKANLHVITLGQISYPRLVKYFDSYRDQYDMLLAIRPSGWEKNSKPSYGKQISVIGIEYSEHSSYKELERFVRYLKPNRVISTVPLGKDLFITGKVPAQWYQYEGQASMLPKAFQTCISTFLHKTPQNHLKSENSRSTYKSIENNEMSMSPIIPCIDQDNNNENDMNDCLTIISSPDLDLGTSSSTRENSNRNKITSFSSSPQKHKKQSQENATSPKAPPVSRFTSDASDDMLSFL